MVEVCGPGWRRDRARSLWSVGSRADRAREAWTDSSQRGGEGQGVTESEAKLTAFARATLPQFESKYQPRGVDVPLRRDPLRCRRSAAHQRVGPLRALACARRVSS